MKTLKLGTIGSGMIVHSILNNVKVIDEIELEAVYSRTYEKGKELADCYDCTKVYTDMDEFLADEAIDVVYIATPNSLHYPQAKACLLAGKNVILEKPFCTNLADAQDLVNIAHEKDLILINAIPTAYFPNLQVVIDNLDKVGNIRLVMCNYSQYSSRIEAFMSGELPNVFNTKFGGGCLSDINYYCVYMTMKLFGKAKSEQYFANIHRGVDTSGVIMLNYGDFIASLVGAKDTWGVNYYQIEGDKGYIYCDRGPNGIGTVSIVTHDSKETINLQDKDRCYYSVKKMSEIILNHDVASMDDHMKTMLETVETMEKLHASAGVVFDIDR